MIEAVKYDVKVKAKINSSEEMNTSPKTENEADILILLRKVQNAILHCVSENKTKIRVEVTDMCLPEALRGGPVSEWFGLTASRAQDGIPKAYYDEY